MKNLFSGKGGRKAVKQGKRNEIEPLTNTTKSVGKKDKKPVEGCKMILCEDPLTGDIRLFPVECPTGYIERIKSKMREKGVRFSSKPLPEDMVLSTPAEEEI
jgi:hypothetical protein